MNQTNNGASRSKSILSFKHLGVVALVLILVYAFKGDKDPLHKRTFNIMLTEVKDGVPAKKIVTDVLDFKDGKLYSEYLADKMGFKWIRYRILKDSIYTDSTETEVRFLQVEGSATNEENTTVTIAFDQVEWDLDGTIKVTKGDKPKKYFDMSGREKGGKPKKPKKKKGEEENQQNPQNPPGDPPK